MAQAVATTVLLSAYSSQIGSVKELDFGEAS